MSNEDIARWVFDTCVLFGASAATAAIVTHVFMTGLADSRTGDPEEKQ